MPRDSNGNASTDPVYVATPGTTIRAVQHNTPIADIIQMLTGSLARNGTGGMLADLAMGGFKITGLANGTSAQDAVTKAQLDATLDDLPQLGAWTNVASASTVNLGAQTSRNIVVTGSTTITSFGTSGASDNVPYLLRFAAAPLITNGANLICQGGANIQAATGDMALVIHDSATVWRLIHFPAIAKTAPPAGHIYGLTTAYVSTTSFSVAAGTAASEGAASISPLKLASSLTKTLSSWVAGTGAGSLDTGAIAANTWYHVHLIATADGSTVDVLLSLSASAPSMPAGYTARRRLGSIKTNASSQVTQFVQLGDDFFWDAPVSDIAISPIPATATLYTLSVPSGVRVTAHITAQQLAPTSNFIGVLLTSPDTADVTPGAAANPPTGPYNVGSQLYSTGSIGGEMLSLRVRTDTSGRIRVRANTANSNPLYVYTYGWTDDRGKL